MTYLLDTNVCIGLINGRPLSVRAKFDEALKSAAAVYVSSISVFELWYGVSKSRRRQFNEQTLAGFLAGPVQQLAFDEQDARFAGEVRAEIEPMGRPIGQYDLLIAGQALRHKMTVITANSREFGRIRNLSWEDWSRG